MRQNEMRKALPMIAGMHLLEFRHQAVDDGRQGLHREILNRTFRLE